MPYRAPIDELLFTMTHAAGMKEGLESGVYADLADGFAATIMTEAAKYAEEVLDPINKAGDIHGSKLVDGVVKTAPGWIDAYAKWLEGGWGSLVAPQSVGGMGLPHLLHSACFEMWTSANMAFMLGPTLSFGAVDALVAHGSRDLRETWIAKLVTGEWPATMNLTEPSAGSDLTGMRTKAERNGDGTYRISGQKFFITYGDHDMTDNIVHLVLARLPDAPAGTRGISLFLVPKFLLDADGTPGKRNDVRCTGLEHKIGIHGSPTCVMSYGDEGGATGWLIGEENRGLACMFTMMNSARLATALQGVAMGERAYQHALAYASERRQGKASDYKGAGVSPIVYHPDVRRNLMTMKALTHAARAICYTTADAIDRAHRATTEEGRKQANERAALMTPVAKAFSTDIGNEVTSIGVQVHGGMGYIEETGAAQFFRDIRIAAIYEGTNGIQAIDLVTRKLPMAGGDPVRREIADMRETLARLDKVNAPEFGMMATRLRDAVDSLERATTWLQGKVGSSIDDALAGATPYLRLFGLARGGVSLAEVALAAREEGESAPSTSRIATARFFAEQIAVGAPGLEAVVVEGADGLRASLAALEQVA
jgi:acyl-CoA dehydrogenase